MSLRGRDVRLLALRGRFAVKGRTLADTIVRPGLCITLATGPELVVLEVELPDTVMALVTSRRHRDGVAQHRRHPGVASRPTGAHHQPGSAVLLATIESEWGPP